MSDLKNIIEKLPNAKKYSNAIYKALMASLEYELGFDYALERLKEEGGALEFSDKFPNRVKERFSELIFLESIIFSTGFSYFRDEIMTRHLDKQFLSVKKDVK
jgi:hypothetical protein